MKTIQGCFILSRTYTFRTKEMIVIGSGLRQDCNYYQFYLTAKSKAHAWRIAREVFRAPMDLVRVDIVRNRIIDGEKRNWQK